MGLGVFEVHAGDFKPGKHHQLVPSHLFEKRGGKLIMDVGRGPFSREKIPLSGIAEVEKASVESVNRLGGAVGWGIAGDVLLGPVGLLAGLVAGSRGTNVEFVCVLKDGRKFIATASSGIFSKLRAAAAQNQWNATHPNPQITTPENKIASQRNKLGRTIAWGFCGVLALAAAGGFVTGDIWPSLLALLAAVFIFPPFAAPLKQAFVPGWMRVTAAAICLLFVGITAPSQRPKAAVPPSEKLAQNVPVSAVAPKKPLSHEQITAAFGQCMSGKAKENGKYTSTDGGHSALLLLGECKPQMDAYLDDCQAGKTGKEIEGKCAETAAILAQATLKLLNR